VKRHAASLVVVLAVLAGCGSGEGGGPAEATDTVTELQILVWPEGARPNPLGRVLGERRLARGKPKTYRLKCDPPGGTFPDPEAACKKLDQVDHPFNETPEDAVCTEQFGGQQVASISGVYRDETVNTRFSREDGCEIARWDEHAFLLEPEK
jgi:subtilisin inhibitor-like